MRRKSALRQSNQETKKKQEARATPTNSLQQKVPGRDAKIGAYSKNTKIVARIQGE
jgi:hypothetical protein